MATVLDDPRERSREAARLPRRRWLGDVVGVAIVVLVVLAGYAAVPFAGKTFSSSSFVPSATVCKTPSGSCEPQPRVDPRWDLGASGWSLEPWAHVVKEDLSQRDLPLWNSLQGIGAPLAGNFQSAAFDPLLALWHLHPTPLVADLSFLAGLLLIGLSAYFAARMIRLGVVASVLVGGAFPLSGWFFSYSNNQWFRIYLYLPLLVGLAEWIVRSHRRLPIALFGCAVAGMVVVGMPEPAFIALVAVSVFGVLRSLIGPRADAEWWKPLARLAGAGLTGILLAAPVLLLAREYIPLSLNSHDKLGGAAPLTDPVSAFINWLMPRISPSDAFAYDRSRNWVGSGVVLLALVGVAAPAAKRRLHAVVPLGVAGALIALQVYGGGIVAWTRHIPGWSSVLWPPFATPVIAFVLIMLAGIGVQRFVDHDVRARDVVIAALVLVALTLLVVLTTDAPLALSDRVVFAGGWPMALLTFALVTGVAVVACVSRRVAWAPLLIVGLVLVELLVIAPRGFYADRRDPYPESALTNFLVQHTSDGSRIFSPDGVLYTDTANAYGLSDIRTNDALYPQRYFDYLQNFVSRGTVDRFAGTGSAEGAPNVAENAMFDLLGVRYVLYRDEPFQAIPPGVLAQVTRAGGPPSWSGDQFRLVTTLDGVRVYENTHVAPRAFVATDVVTAHDEKAALAWLTEDETRAFPDHAFQVKEKDVRRVAVAESGTPVDGGARGCVEPANSATIVDRTSDRVEIAVDSRCGGLLVLTDQYFPGWKATVDGHPVDIHPTDLTFRGVSVPAGASHVVFSYEPSSFRTGLYLFVLGVFVLVGLGVSGALAWHRHRLRGRGSAPSTAGLPSP